jgi:hypothetical protein
MPSFVWAKMWIDTLDDYKLGLLSDHLWRRFFEFVLLAKEVDGGGYLPAIPAIAWRLRTTPQEIEIDLQALAVDDLQLLTLGDTGWFVTNFVKRQETAMDSAERMRRLRERERRAAYFDDSPDVSDTPRNDECDATCDDVVTPRHTEERRGEEEEEREMQIGPATREEGASVFPLSLGDPPPPLIRHTITPDEIPKPDPALGECWQRDILPYLKASVTRSVYDNWFVPITPIAVVDSTVLLGVNEHYQSEWCSRVHGAVLKRTVTAFLERPLDIQFIAFPPGGT